MASVVGVGTPSRFDDHCFIRACRGLPHERVPVWFMRQAGRSLPEYRAIRGTGTILDAIKNPDLSTEITLQPVRRYGVDAAILYSDIVVPVHAIGFGVTVTPGVGPEIEQPFRTAADLGRLRPLDPSVDTPYVLETVRQLVHELDVPLIGFAGAPFTVASYLIEGRPSRDYLNTKSLMLNDEQLWHSLMDRLADLAIASLASQIDSVEHRPFNCSIHGREHFRRPNISGMWRRTQRRCSALSPGNRCTSDSLRCHHRRTAGTHQERRRRCCGHRLAR